MKGQMNLFSGFGEEVCTPLVEIYPPSSETTAYLCTKEHLQELFQEAKNIIEKENFPLGDVEGVCQIDKKMSAWGYCRFVSIKGVKKYMISVSPKLLETTEKSVMQTLLHEFIHATKGCMNHGTIWKKRAAIINAKYGYNIKTKNTPVEMGVKEENMKEFYYKNYKYVLRCKNCGKMIGYKRMNDVVKFPDFYLCGYCEKGKIERIK